MLAYVVKPKCISVCQSFIENICWDGSGRANVRPSHVAKNITDFGLGHPFLPPVMQCTLRSIVWSVHRHVAFINEGAILIKLKTFVLLIFFHSESSFRYDIGRQCPLRANISQKNRKNLKQNVVNISKTPTKFLKLKHVKGTNKNQTFQATNVSNTPNCVTKGSRMCIS